MKIINLLSPEFEGHGARVTSDGVEVDEPWGYYSLRPVDLPGGWYALTIEGADVQVSLQLNSRDAFQIIELQAKPGSPAYVRLNAGQYAPLVYSSVRPGLQPIKSAVLKPLSHLTRFGLLGGRFIQALSSGMSVERLTSLVKQALKPKGTFGIRAKSGHADGLGVLTSADLKSRGHPQNIDHRLSQLKDGAVFLVRGSKVDLNSQVYRRFTLDPSDPYDFVVTVGEGEQLTSDALLLFAEHLSNLPDVSVIVADKWIKEIPTAHVAWDPLLYARGHIPTPYCSRKGMTPEARFDNQSMFSLLSVPVAASQTAETLVEYVEVPPIDGPACSIIIPTRDRADLLKTCLAGLFENTDWPHEVIIVDNGSVESETFAVFDTYRAKGLQVLRADIPFNFSTLSNLGAKAAKNPYLVFLNNDVVLHRRDWLRHMMAYAVLDQAGAVGARLLYADGRLQHGGVMLDLTQVCGHFWRGLERQVQDTEARLRHSSLRSAVTAACLCVNKVKFETVGGFNEDIFPVTLNDIDLCLKLSVRGLVNIYCASAEAYHLEGESRGQDESPGKLQRRWAELAAFDHIWSRAVTHDPYLPLAIGRSSEKGTVR